MNDENKDRQINLNAFGAIYFLIFSISIFFNDKGHYLKFPKTDASFASTMLRDVVLGIVIGLVVVGIGWIMTHKSKALQEIFSEFYTLLGRLSVTEVFFISAFSSLAEEFFFRGLVQAKLGLVFSSVFFGALHSGPSKKFLPWTIFAVAMGFVLGGVYEWKQNLMIPVVIHFVVNFANLMLLQKTGPRKIVS